MITEGEPPPIRPPLSWDQDEAGKQLLTYTAEAAPWVLIDNQRRLDHPVLASLLTTGEFAGRRLGSNESLSVKNARFNLMVTSNNLEMSKEMVNRSYAIRLDAHVPNPGSRTGFVHADLVQYARENRVRLLSALASIVKSWDQAGRPRGPTHEALAGFAGWRDCVGGILHHAGVEGFLENLDSVRARAQDDHLDGQAFVSAWYETYETDSVGVKELHALALPEDGEPLLKLRGADRGSVQSQKIRLGEWLVQNARRMFFGPDRSYLAVIPAGTRHNARQYEIEVSTPPSDAPPVQSESQDEPKTNPTIPYGMEKCARCNIVQENKHFDGFQQCLDYASCDERFNAETPKHGLDPMRDEPKSIGKQESLDLHTRPYH